MIIHFCGDFNSYSRSVPIILDIMYLHIAITPLLHIELKLWKYTPHFYANKEVLCIWVDTF